MKFSNLDLALDELPYADVFMCRDVIQHLSLQVCRKLVAFVNEANLLSDFRCVTAHEWDH